MEYKVNESLGDLTEERDKNDPAHKNEEETEQVELPPVNENLAEQLVEAIEAEPLFNANADEQLQEIEEWKCRCVTDVEKKNKTKASCISSNSIDRLFHREIGEDVLTRYNQCWHCKNWVYSV